MRSKKIKISVLLLCFVLISLPHKIYASELELEDAQILLVYENQVSETDQDNIQTIVEILTYLNYSVSYASIKECEGNISAYDYVICYNLNEGTDSIVKELVNVGHEVMIIGGDLVNQYVDYANLNVEVIKEIGNVGNFTYSYSTKETFSSLIKLRSAYLLKGTFTYENGSFNMNDKEMPFSVSIDNLWYIPVTNLENNLVQSAFTNEVAQWLWPYNGKPHDYAQYIVLDKVYPFMDPNKLMEMVDILINRKLPFVLSVMPIYDNSEYPAMKRFCEVLRYAQDNGGAVILHAPIIQTSIYDETKFNKKITQAMDSYMQYGVYPIAIEAPESWMFDDSYGSILKRYRTVFFYQDEKSQSKFKLESHFNSIYRDGHQIIGPSILLDDFQNGYQKVHSSGVYLDTSNDLEWIKKQIDACEESLIPIKNLWDSSQSVYTDSVHMEYSNNTLTINEQEVSLDYTPFEYEENFDYKRDLMDKVTVNLQKQNKKLIIFVSVTIIIFIIFLVLARYMNRKKFFYPKEK